MIRARGLVLSGFLLSLGCQRATEPERTTFYERKISPVIKTSGCTPSGTGSGCHVLDERGDVLGNVAFDSYSTLNRRRDLLVDYGPYGVPGLLLKNLHPYPVRLTDWRAIDPLVITTQIAHSGGQQFDLTTATYTTLDTWIRNGAAENNAPPAEPTRALDPCSHEVGRHPDFDPNSDPGTPDFGLFTTLAGPAFAQSCAAGNCHGLPSNNLHLTCGSTPEEVRWNYFATMDYVSADATASEILRRALAPDAGGTYHEGGVVFVSRSDPGYRAIEEWAVQKGGPTNSPTDENFLFFADRVQPMLVKRGCMMLGCHSASMFHDYRLRGGSGGQFSLPATRKNYELSLEQLALESPDPNASRLLKKNLSPDVGGILHRGGNLFGEGDADVVNGPCDPVAAATEPIDEQRPYCVIAEWFRREQAARTIAPLSAVVYVRRAAAGGPSTPQDYASYQPGAEVVQNGLTRAADGTLSVGAETNLSALCNLPAGSTDARRPAVSWDGARVAFAARTSSDDPFHVYVVEGGACAIDTDIDAPPVDDSGNSIGVNGELVHNFDPAFAPDGRIVFASTRGNVMNLEAIGYSGPQRAPADPSKLNANLYIKEQNGRIRQLTFLLNQEILPSFMRDGRLIFTAEKRAPDFYQLAGRRMNLDGADYHPLFGQRNTIGFTQLTDVVELADKNLAFILSDKGAQQGAGALAVLNRSLGVDQLSENPDDYLVDPDAINVTTKRFFQRSLAIVDPAATGRLAGTDGAYRHPSPLPDGRLLVSYSAAVSDLGAVGGGFGIEVVNPETAERTPLVSGGGDLSWPVAVYGKQNSGIFASRLDEANGATRIGSGSAAEVTILDVGTFGSLLFQNTRSGRPLTATSLSVWESLPPAPGVTDYASGGIYTTSDDYGQLYVRRQLLDSVGVQPDQSAAMRVPGGVPLIVQTNAKLSADGAATLHSQREEMQFYPGEQVRQSLQRRFFNGLCGGCHGSVSGREFELAVQPDILTQASQVAARGKAKDLTGGALGGPQGPTFP
ncbi:MAG TPA: hypothetical protein VGK73_15950 [Polyangiaceae bacterium]